VLVSACAQQLFPCSRWVYPTHCLCRLFNILSTAFLIPNARRVRRHKLVGSFFYYIVKHPQTAEVPAALVSEEIPAWCALVAGLHSAGSMFEQTCERWRLTECCTWSRTGNLKLLGWWNEGGWGGWGMWYVWGRRELHTEFGEETWRKRSFGRPRCKWRILWHMILKKQNGRAWTGFICLRVGASSRLFCAR
jgi:hypothetical protein